MKNKNLIWGGILIALGLLFLGENFDWFHLNLQSIAKFWPILFILAGINSIIARKTGATPTALTGILIFLAIPLGVFTTFNRGVDQIENKIGNIFDDNDNFDEKDDNESDEKTLNIKTVVYTNETEAKLNLTGGAAEFSNFEETTNLFNAKSDLSGKTDFKLTTSTDNGKTNIDYKMSNLKSRKYDSDSSNINIDLNSKNKIEIGLNKKPIWDLSMQLGAGLAKFDLSNYKIKTVDIETGAASLDLKLGDLLQNTEVKVKSGLAKIQIRIPKTVGCEVEVDGALNEKDFEDFEKDGNGHYHTSNFSSATKKIKIKLEAGLSSLEIERY